MKAPKNWRQIELANGRSPATGRPLRKPISINVEVDYPSPEDYRRLAHYSALIRRNVDHRTAFEQAGYGYDDRESEALLLSWQLDGLLVIGERA